MPKFTVRMDNNQKTVLVDPSNYQHTLEIAQKPTVTRYKDHKVDNFRYSINVSDGYAVRSNPTCEKDCGTNRIEAVNISFVIAMGQKPEYYKQKARQLSEAATRLKAAADTAVSALASGGSLSKDVDVVDIPK